MNLNFKDKKILLILALILLLAASNRLFKLGSNPPSMHGDELGVGYNAYAILKTGADEYGKRYPLIFRHDVSPVLIYLTVPSIYLFDLNEIGTRLPTGIIGSITIVSIYYLIKIILKSSKLALLTAFFLSISTWHIRTSRIALDMVWGLFFQIIATYLLIKSINKKSYLLSMVSFFLYLISIYSYQSTKVTSPLIIVYLIILFRKKILKQKMILFNFILLIIFIIIPSLIYLFSIPVSNTRFAQISVFTQWKSYFPNDSIIMLFFNPNALLKLLILIISNFFEHFDPKILFMDNSLLRYHQLTKQGLFYLWQAPFIVIGILNSIINLKKTQNKIIIGWLLIALVPSMLTTGIPYANISRALMMLPIILLFSAKGLLLSLKFVKEYLGYYFKYLLVIIIVVTCLSIYSFEENYHINQPEEYAYFWGLPLKDAATKVNSLENTADRIIFTTTISPQSYMYILFYGHKDPTWLIQNGAEKAKIVGYSSFGKYEFRPINWERDKNIPNALLIGSHEEIPLENDTNLTNITIANSVKLKIYKTSN